jgi:hypothetical protein
MHRNTPSIELLPPVSHLAKVPMGDFNVCRLSGTGVCMQVRAQGLSPPFHVQGLGLARGWYFHHACCQSADSKNCIS